jgi:hypothetical protein
MPVTVVNLRREPFTVYIGRANRHYNLPQSKWANPFLIPRDGDRDEVIAKYRAYVLSRPDLLEALADINYQRLGCWCAPLRCHGDVLAELIAERERVS